MKLTYQITNADQIAFFMYHYLNTRQYKTQLLSTRALGIAVFVSLSYYLEKRFPGAVFLIGFVLAILSWTLAPYLLKFAQLRHFKTNVAERYGDSLDEFGDVELCEDGMKTSSQRGESIIKYSFIGRITLNGHYTYIYTSKAAALILPADKIPKEQIDKFVSELKKRIETAS